MISKLNTSNKMENPKRKKTTVWYDRGGQVSDYKIHPGNLLATHTAWTKNPDDYSSYISGPEPDVVNIGVLALEPIDLGLDYVYYVKPDPQKPEWISFGWTLTPKALIKQLADKPWRSYWINPRAQLPREVKFCDPLGVEM